MELNSSLLIKTNRIILKPIHEKYIDDIYISFTPEVTKYMPFNPSGNKNDIIKFVEDSKRNLMDKTEVVFVILDMEENFIGCCGIHNINPESVEVGLWLKEDFQSQGFGTEVVVSLMHFVEQNFKINYIIYPVDKENIRSRKIPEKLGFSAFKTYTKRKNDLVNLSIIEYRKYFYT